MSTLAALIAGLVAGWAFARGRPQRLATGLIAALLAAGLAHLVAASAGDEPLAGAGIGVMAAAALIRGLGATTSHRPLIGILCGLLLLRLGVAVGGGLPLAPDEAQYWDWSRSLDLAYYSKPGGIAWLISAWTAVAGDGLAALRLLGLVLAVGAVALVWPIARTHGSPGTAWLATVLAAALPIHACTAGMLTTDVPLLLCWAGFLAVLLRTPAAGGTAAWWHGPALGLLLALGLNAKYAMLYGPLAILLATWSLPQARAWLGQGAPWIALVIGLGGLAPVLLWNSGNDWIGLLHLAGQGGGGKGLQPLRPLEFLGGQLAVGLPASLLLLPACRWAWLVRHERPAAWLIALAALAPLGVLLVFSLQAKVQPNWPAMAWLPAAVLVAWWLEADARPWPRRVLHAGLAIVLVGAVLIAAAPSVRRWLPDLPPSVPERKLHGWDDLAVAIDREVSAEEPPAIVLTGGYDVAAELAWHNRHLPRPRCANFGRRMNQYDLWGGLETADRGRDVIFAAEVDRYTNSASDLRRLLPPGLADDFASCDEPRLIVSGLHGRVWRCFLVVRLRSFDGVLDSARPPTTW